MKASSALYGFKHHGSSRPGSAGPVTRRGFARKWLGPFTGAILAVAMMASAGWAAETVEAMVQPASISIGAFYDGANMQVNGTIPADCEAVIRITGQTSDLHLRKKGKAFGLLWMNLDTLVIENVPSAYLLFVPENFDQPASASPPQGSVQQLTLASLEQQIRIVPQSLNSADIFKELLKLKKSEGLYAEVKGKIHYGQGSGDRKPFQADLQIPSRLAPATYQIDLYAVKDGQIVSQTSQKLPVELTGFPALLLSLALQHGAVYGVLATLAALVAGLLMGFFFGGGKGSH